MLSIYDARSKVHYFLLILLIFQHFDCFASSVKEKNHLEILFGLVMTMNNRWKLKLPRLRPIYDWFNFIRVGCFRLDPRIPEKYTWMKWTKVERFRKEWHETYRCYQGKCVTTSYCHVIQSCTLTHYSNHTQQPFTLFWCWFVFYLWRCIVSLTKVWDDITKGCQGCHITTNWIE